MGLRGCGGLVGLHSSLYLFSGAAVGPFVRDCETESQKEQRMLCTAHGRCCKASPARIADNFGFRWLVRRGNHVRTTLGVWVCRRQGGFGVLPLRSA
ncbi:hypothetical protein Taro_027003, partial [Colocasia esculenta]|nr:hypothetical protein [Colocasia esculenta]